MRRSDREMDRAFALGIIDKCAYGVVSMADGGIPYGVPLSIVRDGEKIYFHCAAAGKKSDIINKNSRVCVVCVGDVIQSETDFSTEYESAIAFGNAVLVADEDEKVAALRLISQKYTPSVMGIFDSYVKKSLHVTAVYRIDIDEITGKRKKLGPDGREIKGNTK